MRVRYRVALACACTLAATAALAASSWPYLLEGAAKRRVEHALGRRFDSVEMSCFELDKTTLEMCDVRLELGGAAIELDHVAIAFDVQGFDSVLVESVVLEGGRVEASLEDLLEMQPEASGDGGGRSRVSFEGSTFEARGIELAVSRQDASVAAIVATATSTGTHGPVTLLLEDVGFSRGASQVAGAGSVNLELDPRRPFPLALDLHDASASPVEGVAARDVAGTLVILDQDAHQVEADLRGETDGGQNWTFRGSVDRNARTVSATLTARGVRPGQVPGAGSLPLDPDRGSVSVDVHLDGSDSTLHVDGNARLDGVVATHPRLARDEVVLSGDVELEGLRVDLEGDSVVLEGASLTPRLADGSSSQVVLVASGQVDHLRDPAARRVTVQVQVGRAGCQEMLRSVPPGLVPALDGFELEGDASADLRVHVDVADPEATVLEGGVHLDGCRIRRAPRQVESLDGPFSHSVRMKSGRVVSRHLALGSPFFAALDELPAHVAGGPVATEDGGFWRHDGFLASHFEAALRHNVEAGGFVRGASTITMQMVKNVLLSHEKTLSRKMQEMFLTWVVERKLSKQRIMEIYLNVVEFGPGIYGIGHASRHYFDKSPQLLTSLEAAYLATLLPRPVARHEELCRGSLSSQRMSYVRAVHRRMLSKGSVSQEDFDAAEALGLAFSSRGASDRACLDSRMAEGTFTQEAISGLLARQVGR